MQLSRRHLLTLAASAGVAAALATKAKALEDAWPRPDPQDDDRWLFLKPAEVAFLIAATDRLIPQDEYPSASQAGVVDYIDLQLATDWGAGAGLYMEPPFRADIAQPSQGYQLEFVPAALYRRAIAALAGQLERPFTEMADEEQDGVLQRLESGEMDLGDADARTFFGILHRNTLEGYFADPIYGGNRELAGWRMVGFPGAHAYYSDLVGEHGRPYFRPPAGITQPASTTMSAAEDVPGRPATNPGER